MIFRIALLVILYWSATASANQSPLRFGLSLSDSPPVLFYVEENNKSVPTGGIAYATVVALAKELDRSFEVDLLPRTRLLTEVKDHKIDLICQASPRWRMNLVDEDKNKIEWSEMLFSYSDIIVGTKKISAQAFGELQGEVIGTISDYVYPEQEELFEKRKNIRDDSKSIEMSLTKLLRDRFNYMIMNDIEYGYYKRFHPQLNRSAFVLNKFKIYCALSTQSSLKMPALNQAIKRLQAKNFFEKLFEEYRLKPSRQESVNFLINANYSAPYVYLSGSSRAPTTRGLVKALGQSLAQELNRNFNWIDLPRSRVGEALQDGTADLICFMHEKWIPYKNVEWSIPILDSYDVLAILESDDVKNITSLDKLPPGKIGTILKFRYPSIEPLLAKGVLTREDSGSISLNIEKLRGHKLKYIILDRVSYEYYSARYPDLKRLPIEVDPLQQKCALVKNSKLSIGDLNHAISQLQKKQIIDYLIQQEVKL